MFGRTHSRFAHILKRNVTTIHRKHFNFNPSDYCTIPKRQLISSAQCTFFPPSGIQCADKSHHGSHNLQSKGFSHPAATRCHRTANTAITHLISAIHPEKKKIIPCYLPQHSGTSTHHGGKQHVQNRGKLAR